MGGGYGKKTGGDSKMKSTILLSAISANLAGSVTLVNVDFTVEILFPKAHLSY